MVYAAIIDSLLRFTVSNLSGNSCATNLKVACLSALVTIATISSNSDRAHYICILYSHLIGTIKYDKDQCGQYTGKVASVLKNR